MPVETKLERCPPDHPDRCKSSSRFAQCPFYKTPGSEFCVRHCAMDVQAVTAERELRNYQLSKFRAEVLSKADNPKVKSLREEIGILRQTLESVWNQCHDSDDIVHRSGMISDLVSKIDKLVSSCHRLESATGQLLDRQVALTFADKVVQIIQVNVKDPEAIRNISDQLVVALNQSTDPTLALVNQTYGPKETVSDDNDD